MWCLYETHSSISIICILFKDFVITICSYLNSKYFYVTSLTSNTCTHNLFRSVVSVMGKYDIFYNLHFWLLCVYKSGICVGIM